MNAPTIRCTAWILSALLVAACQSPTISGGNADGGGLAEVRYSGMDMALADPGIDFSSYDNVVIEDISFERLRIVDPAHHSPRYGRFTLDDSDKARLRQAYRERVAAALEKSGLATRSEAGPGSLKLVTELVKLEPNAPREKDERFGPSARNETFTRGAGSMTLSARLVDAATGRTVASMEDKITDHEVWGENNPVTNRAAVQRAFTRWAAKLSAQLRAFRTR